MKEYPRNKSEYLLNVIKATFATQDEVSLFSVFFAKKLSLEMTA